MKTKDKGKMKKKRRPDTGWDCCICDRVATVNGVGFTWCKKHWEEFDLGYAREEGNPITVASMREKYKSFQK